MHLDCDQGCHEEKYSETLDHTSSVQGSNEVNTRAGSSPCVIVEIKASSDLLKCEFIKMIIKFCQI
jgi:hypothetical protein